mgnify:CR=1 FL=1
MSKRSKFVKLAHQEVLNHSLYLWGGQGESVLATTPRKVIDMEDTMKNAGRVLRTLSARVLDGYIMTNAKYFDCSGLIVWLLMLLGLITRDYTAHGIYTELCTPITRDDLKSGDLCFIKTNGKCTHVGIYSADYGVIEAAGRDIGVVERSLSANKWNTYGRLKVW